MKFSGFKRILREDLARAGGEMPKWLDQLLSPINLLIENVGQALQNRLNLSDNFYCKEISLKLTSGLEQEINPTTPFAQNARAYGVLILSTNGAAQSAPHVWSNKSNGNVALTVTFTSAAESICTILILLR